MKYPHEFEDAGEHGGVCRHCNLSDFCSETECPARLRAELDRILDKTKWATTFTPLELAAMEFARAWMHRVPYAAGLSACIRLREAANTTRIADALGAEHVGPVDVKSGWLGALALVQDVAVKQQDVAKPNPFDIEHDLIPPDQWATCGAPTEALQLATEETANGIPAGIARHAGRWYVLVSAGQGPMIAWEEPCTSS